ncbi:MAG TPA: osmotically inducible protein OsmC [Solibacterales bacterium]|nr:osmotically inducible protein OsmC [Bryobacterales bacterium]
MEVTIEHLGEVQFEATARGHKVVCDQPSGNGGFNEGMTPPELLLASLGTCAGYYAVEYLKSRSLPIQDLRVRVVAEKAKNPARLGSFVIEVDAKLDNLDANRDGLHRAVEKCLIHNTLLNAPRIQVEIGAPVLA